MGAPKAWTSYAELAHIAANGPSVIIRHCERDLKTLERHAPIPVHTNIDPEMPACRYLWVGGDGWLEQYPCFDMRDLAEAYDLTWLVPAPPAPTKLHEPYNDDGVTYCGWRIDAG